MDIITHKSSMTPQVESAEVNRSAARANVVTQAAQAQLQPENIVPMDQQLLEETVASIQEATQVLQRDLNFSLDDSSGQMVVKVTDSASGKVVRQMPTEEALRMAESLDEMRSLLFKTQA